MRHCRRATKLRLDSCQQFDHLERLGYVVVGAELEANHLVDDLTLCGQHDHRGLRPAFSQLAQHVEPVQSWQHDVEEHKIERLSRRAFESAFSINARFDGVSLAREPIAKRQHPPTSFATQPQPHHAGYPWPGASYNAARPIGSSLAAGNVTVNSLPAPGWLCTVIFPPCARTIRCTRLRPRPVPWMRAAITSGAR